MAADCLLMQQKSMVSGIGSELRLGEKRVDVGKCSLVVMPAELLSRLFVDSVRLNAERVLGRLSSGTRRRGLRMTAGERQSTKDCDKKCGSRRSAEAEEARKPKNFIAISFYDTCSHWEKKQSTDRSGQSAFCRSCWKKAITECNTGCAYLSNYVLNYF